LFAPALVEAQIDLRRLLVVRPGAQNSALEQLTTVSRLAVKLAEARLFSVLVVDMVGAAWGSSRTNTAPFKPLSLKHWGKTVRRLAMAISGTATQIILLTDRAAPRTLPLPVALRLELQRRGPNQLSVTVAKDHHGRVSPAQFISLIPTPGIQTVVPAVARNAALRLVVT
jgi:recombination protein RecA